MPSTVLLLLPLLLLGRCQAEGTPNRWYMAPGINAVYGTKPDTRVSDIYIYKLEPHQNVPTM